MADREDGPKTGGSKPGGSKTGIGRRQLLAGAAAAGVAVTAKGAGAFGLKLPAGELASPLLQKTGGAQAGTLIYGVTQEAVNFNPLLYVNTGVETAVEYAVFDAPWKIDDKGQFVPNLATEIPSVANGGISQDGLEWTIKLKPGVKWHDGAPFTAKDLLFTYETVMNPKVAARGRTGHDQVADISAADDTTVRIKLKQAFAPYMAVWQKTSIIPQHLLAGEADLNTSGFNTAPVGTGPFKFVSRTAGDHIEFGGNADYHGDGPRLKTLIQKYVPDQQTLFAQFQTGQVHVLELQGIPPELYPRAKALPGKTMVISPSPFVEFIYFNCGKPQFADKAVRQALYQAMDVKNLIEKIYFGIPPRTLSYLPTNHWAYDQGLKDPGTDPAKAAQMLDAAGWTVGGDGIREKGGVKLSFTISTTAGNKSRERAQQLLQQNLKAINVDMRIQNMPASVVWGEYTVKSQFDTLMVGWDPLLFPDPDYGARIMSDQIPAKGGNGSNYVQYENPEIDKLCRQGVAETDQDKRKAIYAKIQETLLDDLPFAPIFVFSQIFGFDNAVKNYKPNPYVPINLWNCNEWSIG